MAQRKHFEVSISEQILRTMKTLGYRSLDQGICEGIVLMAGISFLATKNKEPFEYWLTLLKYLTTKHQDYFEGYTVICNPDDPTIKNMLEIRCSEKVAEELSKRHVKNELENALELWALFDGIQLALNPDLYPALFNKCVNQGEFEKILPFVRSKLADEMLADLEYIRWSDVFDVSLLSKVITRLSETATQYEIKMVLHINSYNHTVGLAFHSQKKLVSLLIPSMLDDKSLLQQQRSSYEIATLIFKEFFEDISAQSALHLSLQFNPRNCDDLRKFIETSIMPDAKRIVEVMNLPGQDGYSLPFIAALNNDYRTLEVILNSKQFDYNSQTADRTAFIEILCQNNCSAIKLVPAHLLSQKIKDYYPVHIAALNDATEVLTHLYKNGLNFNVLSPHGLTPLQLAKRARAINAIDFLSKLEDNTEFSLVQNNKRPGFFAESTTPKKNKSAHEEVSDTIQKNSGIHHGLL